MDHCGPERTCGVVAGLFPSSHLCSICRTTPSTLHPKFKPYTKYLLRQSLSPHTFLNHRVACVGICVLAPSTLASSNKHGQQFWRCQCAVAESVVDCRFACRICCRISLPHLLPNDDRRFVPCRIVWRRFVCCPCRLLDLKRVCVW